MNKKEKRAAALKAAQDIINSAKAGGRDLSEDEVTEVKGYRDEVERLGNEIKAAEEQDSLIKGIEGLSAEGKAADGGKERSPEYLEQVKSLGEHFVKHAGARLKEIAGVKGASATAPEFKAAGDTHVVGSVFQTPVLTQFDRTIITAPRQRLVIADLLGKGIISGNAISYFVEGGIEGGFETVAETGLKPQLHVLDPHLVTDSLKKIAGWISLSDEMIEDLDFVVSEINTRLLYELAAFEERQLLQGDGNGTNILGLLNRSGLQTMAYADNAADSIFRGITACATGSGLDADGVAINPLDYQVLRLTKDGNQQYMGGGFFTGQYGNGGIMEQPPIWGLRTVITPAIPVGMALVGAFAQAATVYRKGGVRVESTNSHADNFTHNIVTIRAEERIALAVRKPAAFVKVALRAA